MARSDLRRRILQMKRFKNGAIHLLIFLGLAHRASACSSAACVNGGTEMRNGFLVTIKHGGRPLVGANVEIKEGVDGAYAQRFSGRTDQNGNVHVSGLPRGDYWLKADLLGIDAAYECFHVAENPTKEAKRELKFDWGDLAPSTRQVAGKLVYCEPTQGKNSMLAAVRCNQLPVAGANFKLRHPTTGAIYTAYSDANGTFTFIGVPSGTYVLHIEGGRTSDREYDSADLLIDLSPKARFASLLLTKRDAGGGNCGGTSLDLTTSSTQ
jgi:hypothetical protein